MSIQKDTQHSQIDNPNTTMVVEERHNEDQSYDDNIVYDSPNTNKRSSTKELYLEDKTLREYIDFTDNIIAEQKKSNQRSNLDVGLHYNPEDDKNFIVVPDWFFTSTELVPALIIRLAVTIGCPVIKKDNVAFDDTTFGLKNNKFLTGLIVSILDNKKVTLVETKDSYEMGRKIGHALRYYAELRGRGVPSQLIRKKHAWFENQPKLPGGIDNSTKVYLEKYMKKIIKDGNLYKFTMSFIRFGFQQLRWSGDETALTPHMVPFSEYITSFYRVKGFSAKEKQINKKKDSGLRKPERPNRTTTFTSTELDIVRALMKPYWKSHKSLQEKWSENLLSGGSSYFDGVKETLTHEYNLRWSLLERFGNVSTKRLRTIRKKVNKPNLKKREITVDDLTNTLMSMGPFWIEKFSFELKYIFGEDIYDNFAKTYKISPKEKNLKEKLSELLAVKFEFRDKQLLNWAKVVQDTEADRELRNRLKNQFEPLINEINEDEARRLQPINNKTEINIPMPKGVVTNISNN
jgi:hypothetical protein